MKILFNKPVDGIVFILLLFLSTSCGEKGGYSLVDSGPITVLQVVAGSRHTCALLSNKKVRCWGEGELGCLGHGNTRDIGDDETPNSVSYLDIGGSVRQLTSGQNHTCALLENGKVRCWGVGTNGQLGYGNTNSIGDDETPATAGDVNIGGEVQWIGAGVMHTCAVLTTGKVQCWGSGANGRLGYNNTSSVGDTNNPSDAGDVGIAGTAVQVVAGNTHSCALLTDGVVRCWGDDQFFNPGVLGYGNGNAIGDNPARPVSGAGAVPVTGPGPDNLVVTQIASTRDHTCVLFEEGTVRCWGVGSSGRLGYGATTNIGNTLGTLPSLSGPVSLGGEKAIHIAAGETHTCAVLESGIVRCWGYGANGRLGYGNTSNLGDVAIPDSVNSMDLGAPAVQIAAGGSHTCAILESGKLRCWGNGSDGQLGYGNTLSIGDNETAALAGDVHVTD